MDQYDTFYFENQISHFDREDTRTYQQRYWYNDKFFDKDNGPIFLYICGEWTCTPPDTQMFPMIVGADHNALLMSLEHRYYGDSQPFEDWSTPNLKYLTSVEALADVAQFIENQNEQLGRKADWIVIGGSYPGALAAWFKSQYPEHAVGAWSSSGVIHAIKDFKTFDKDLYDRAELNKDECPNNVKEVIDHIAREFESEAGTKRVCETFGIKEDELNKKDFQFYLADIFTTGVQYGNRVKMCDQFFDASESIDTLMAAVVQFGNNAGVTYDGYWHKNLQDTTININDPGRQWTYEYCTQFAFFQTPNDVFPMRSEELGLPFWSYYCKAIFGDDIGEPAVDQVNKLYGGLDIMGDNIFFLNGSEDPWQYAAMTEIKQSQTTHPPCRQLTSSVTPVATVSISIPRKMTSLRL